MGWYYDNNHQSYSALEAGCEIKHARDPAFRPGRRHGLLIKHRVPSRNWELYTRSWRDEQLFRRPDGAPGAADHACAGIVCKTGGLRFRRSADKSESEGADGGVPRPRDIIYLDGMRGNMLVTALLVTTPQT